MNTLVSAPHLTFASLPQPSSSHQPSITSPPAPSKPRLRPLSLLITTPSSPPPRASGSGSGSSTPLGSPNAAGASGRRRAGVKRMSSISYSPRRPGSDGLGSPALISALLPPSSSNTITTFSSSSAPPSAPPALAQAQAQKHPNPAALTLAEKHADLLTFIAQKESRVMDLRRQLQEAEKELQGLKRKWEGLVARSQGQPGQGAAQAALGEKEREKEKGRGKSVGEVLKQGGRIFNELVFDSPVSSLPSVTSPPSTTSTTAAANGTTANPTSATSTGSSPALALFSPAPTKPTHVQMQPIKKPALRDSISSSASGSSSTTTTTTTTEDSSAPRSPSPLSTMSTLSGLSSSTAKPHPQLPSDAGPTLQALTTSLNRALDGIRTSETYTTSSKRASALFTSGLGQLSNTFGLGFAPPSGKVGLADYGEGKLTSPTSRRRSGSASGFQPLAQDQSQSRPALSALTLGITSQVSQKPALSPIPSPASSRINLLDDPLSDPLLGGGSGGEVLVPSPISAPLAPSPGSSVLSFGGAMRRDSSALPTPRSAGGHRLGMPGVNEEAGEGEGDIEDAWGW